MLDYIKQLPAETKFFILRTAITIVAFIVVVIVFLVMKRKVKRSFFQLNKVRKQIDEHEIETIRTGFFSRSDVKLWIKDYMKSGTDCVLMTGETAKDKDHDIVLPSANGGRVFYLCIYHTGKQKVIRQRFIVADSVEPELDSLISQHSGAVWFTH